MSIPIQDFIDLLNQNGLSLDDVTTDDMEEDLKTLQRLRKKYEKKAQSICMIVICNSSCLINLSLINQL